MGTLQALLTELSGLKKPRGFMNRVVRRVLGLRPKPPPKYRIMVVMATNMPQALDEALLRPGRLDRIYKVGYPSKAGRVRTYQGYLNKVAHNLTPEQIDKLATITPYATGATIKDLVNEALILSIRDGRDRISWPDVLRAKQLKELGLPEDVEYVERERHAVAVHEACHAVVAYRVRHHLQIDVATIEKGGSYLGLVASIKPEDRFTTWRSEYEADVMVALGSLAGERHFFAGDSSSGVSGDLESATTIASLMEGYWGMGSTVASHGVTQQIGAGRPGGPPREGGKEKDLLGGDLGSAHRGKAGRAPDPNGATRRRQPAPDPGRRPRPGGPQDSQRGGRTGRDGGGRGAGGQRPGVRRPTLPPRRRALSPGPPGCSPQQSRLLPSRCQSCRIGCPRRFWPRTAMAKRDRVRRPRRWRPLATGGGRSDRPVSPELTTRRPGDPAKRRSAMRRPSRPSRPGDAATRRTRRPGDPATRRPDMMAADRGTTSRLQMSTARGRPGLDRQAWTVTCPSGHSGVHAWRFPACGPRSVDRDAPGASRVLSSETDAEWWSWTPEWMPRHDRRLNPGEPPWSGIRQAPRRVSAQCMARPDTAEDANRTTWIHDHPDEGLP